MHSWRYRSLLVLLLVTLMGLFFPHPSTDISAQGGQQLHFSFEGTPVPGAAGGPAIPANCSSWHELYPDYCTYHHQDGYEDDGDGGVSACDYITLSGVRYHIVWVGPTYHMTCFQPGPPTQVIAEPVQQQPGENPVCEVWHEIWPNFCREFHVDSWLDRNGNGVLDECDEIDLQPPQVPQTTLYHIDRITLDIIVEPADPTESKKGTWGWLKSLFR